MVEVDNPDVHSKFAIALYGPEIRALQLVWTAELRSGRLPAAAASTLGGDHEPMFPV